MFVHIVARRVLLTTCLLSMCFACFMPWRSFAVSTADTSGTTTTKPQQHIGIGHKSLPLHVVDFTRDGKHHPSHALVLDLKPRVDELTEKLRELREYSAFSTLELYEKSVDDFAKNVDSLQKSLSGLCNPIYEELSVVDKETFGIRERLSSLQQSLSIIVETESSMNEGQQEGRGRLAHSVGSNGEVEDDEDTIRKSKAAVKSQIQENAEALENAEVRWAVLATTKQVCTQLGTYVGAFPQQLDALRGDLAIIKSRRMGGAVDGGDL